MFEIGAVVILNITFLNTEIANIALNGYENTSVAAISTKGHMDDPTENQRLRENIRYIVDNLSKLNTFIIYDVCSTNDVVF